MKINGEYQLDFRKFRDPVSGAQTVHGNDFLIVRYADALLIYAEAANQVDNNPAISASDQNPGY